ncbi:hypothetical protein D5086_005246 [Populus alba]|uniref:Uncharacterized protein n=1 Tax=Populus alba TaxID=43335 RepID=A0ACC4CT51_POPAL
MVSKLTPIIKRDIAEITKLGTDESESYGRNTGLIDSCYSFYLFPEQSSADSTFSKKKEKPKPKGTRSVPATKAIKRSGKVDGNLMPPDGPDSWPQKNSRRQWLVFYRINEMSLQGGGVIYGRGRNGGIFLVNHTRCANQTSAVSVSEILYENIKGTYNIRSSPMHFACSDSLPCTNITLSDVELLPAEGYSVLDPYCWNAIWSFTNPNYSSSFLLDGGHSRINLE